MNRRLRIDRLARHGKTRELWLSPRPHGRTDNLNTVYLHPRLGDSICDASRNVATRLHPVQTALFLPPSPPCMSSSRTSRPWTGRGTDLESQPKPGRTLSEALSGHWPGQCHEPSHPWTAGDMGPAREREERRFDSRPSRIGLPASSALDGQNRDGVCSGGPVQHGIGFGPAGPGMPAVGIKLRLCLRPSVSAPPALGLD
ncbi:hypothetical protein CDD83_10508 [Cordyceps sp. RAO-2017]|nr:hypothetical protein CDD83_10508 [Cordyceps sp. RAO-2017]